jgi:hypothetical protein
VAGKQMPGVLRMLVLFRYLFEAMFLVLSGAEEKNLGPPWFSWQPSRKSSEWKP